MFFFSPCFSFIRQTHSTSLPHFLSSSSTANPAASPAPTHLIDLACLATTNPPRHPKFLNPFRRSPSLPSPLDMAVVVVVVVVVFELLLLFFSMGLVAMVVVWFLILFEFGCDNRLWLKWWFGGCVGGGLVTVVLVWCLILSVGLILAMGFGCNTTFLKCVMMYMNIAKLTLFFFFEREDRGEGKVVTVIING